MTFIFTKSTDEIQHTHTFQLQIFLLPIFVSLIVIDEIGCFYFEVNIQPEQINKGVVVPHAIKVLFHVEDGIILSRVVFVSIVLAEAESLELRCCGGVEEDFP